MIICGIIALTDMQKVMAHVQLKVQKMCFYPNYLARKAVSNQRIIFFVSIDISKFPDCFLDTLLEH